MTHFAKGRLVPHDAEVLLSRLRALVKDAAESVDDDFRFDLDEVLEYYERRWRMVPVPPGTVGERASATGGVPPQAPPAGTRGAA